MCPDISSRDAFHKAPVWVDRRGRGREDGMARELMSWEISKVKKEAGTVERPLLAVWQLQDCLFSLVELRPVGSLYFQVQRLL